MNPASTRRYVRAAAGLLAALAALLVGPSVAQAAEGSEVGIRPAADGDWFQAALSPGESTVFKAVVQNKTPRQVTVQIYPVDALITPQGSFALQGREAARTGLSKWLSIPVTSLTLPAASQQIVDVALTVPADAEPGDFAGGIVIEQPPREGTSAAVGNQTAVQFNVVERVGVRVYLDVKGAAVRTMSVGSLTFERDRSGSLVFRLPVRNEGTVRFSPDATLKIGGTSLAFTSPETLLPGTVVTLTATWDSPPAFMRGEAVATVHDGVGTQTRAVSVTLIPWKIAGAGLVAAVILIAAIVWLVRFVRRARRALKLVELPRATGSDQRLEEPHEPVRSADEAEPLQFAEHETAGIDHEPARPDAPVEHSREDAAMQYLRLLYPEDDERAS